MPALGFGPEGEPIRPRPAAQVARRPLAFPSPVGAAMTIGGSLLILIGAFTVTIPEQPLTVFGFGGGRTPPLLLGGLMVTLSLTGRFSPSRVLRTILVFGAVAAAVVVVIDTRRLVGPRGAGMGLTLVGALVVIGGSLLREER